MADTSEAPGNQGLQGPPGPRVDSSRQSGASGDECRRITEAADYLQWSCGTFGPFWHPDGKRIIFASNMADPKGMEFDLYMINADGTGLERITYERDFDGFPMFTSNGKRLVWASNRNGSHPHDTNLFLADWAD